MSNKENDKGGGYYNRFSSLYNTYYQLANEYRSMQYRFNAVNDNIKSHIQKQTELLNTPEDVKCLLETFYTILLIRLKEGTPSLNDLSYKSGNKQGKFGFNYLSNKPFENIDKGLISTIEYTLNHHGVRRINNTGTVLEIRNNLDLSCTDTRKKLTLLLDGLALFIKQYSSEDTQITKLSYNYKHTLTRILPYKDNQWLMTLTNPKDYSLKSVESGPKNMFPKYFGDTKALISFIETA